MTEQNNQQEDIEIIDDINIQQTNTVNTTTQEQQTLPDNSAMALMAEKLIQFEKERKESQINHSLANVDQEIASLGAQLATAAQAQNFVEISRLQLNAMELQRKKQDLTIVQQQAQQYNPLEDYMRMRYSWYGTDKDKTDIANALAKSLKDNPLYVSADFKTITAKLAEMTEQEYIRRNPRNTPVGTPSQSHGTQNRVQIKASELSFLNTFFPTVDQQLKIDYLKQKGNK